MVLEGLKTQTISLPLIGTISIAAAIAIGVAAFFMLRRKKSIGIKF